MREIEVYRLNEKNKATVFSSVFKGTFKKKTSHILKRVFISLDMRIS